MGFIGVGAFFFLSGFGLVKASNTTNYFKCFLRKHFVKLFIPLSFAVLTYFLLFVGLLRETLSVYINDFLSGYPVSNSWYVYANLFCYFLFWVCFKLLNTSYSICRVLSVGLGITLYSVFIELIGFPRMWIETIPGFFIGVLWGTYHEYIKERIRKHKYISIFLAFSTFNISWLLPGILRRVGIVVDVVWIANEVSMGIAGAFSTGILIELYTLRNAITSFLGRISYEVYLWHGLFIHLFEKTNMGGYSEPWLLMQEVCSILVVLGSICVSIPAHLMAKNIIQKLLSKNCNQN